ncbi:hypothetical protein N2M06_03850 [Oceanimonas sp. AH20CE76]|uniref:glycosyltransferase n=1 Tax=Oceanimonas sp. AH20CE76 TaxID=2977120 RepID=UPI0031FF2F55
MKKILFLYFDYFMKKALEENIKMEDFNLSFYGSDEWGDKANSTSRLLITNFQAIEKLKTKGFNIEQVAVTKINNTILDKLKNYDLVIVNQTANNKSHEITSELIDYIKKERLYDKFIFGTEVTWFAELAKGRYTEEQLDAIYTKCTLLRHTAKTDRPIYAKNKKNNIIEFEIGLDTNLVKSEKKITERNSITFVCAPPGRVTKNNELVDEIIGKIISSEKLNHLKVKKVTPPYRTSQLWSIYDNTRYLIFTSNGETFSYVLNDAKSKGVVTLYPEHMFENNISGEYTVVSYPESGVHYKTTDELINKIIELEKNKESLKLESYHSRDFVVKNFSIEKISENWERLITGRPINTKKCYLLDSSLESFGSKSEFQRFIMKNDIHSVIIIEDKNNLSPEFDALSYYDKLNGILYHRYIYNINGGTLRKFVKLDDKSKMYKYTSNGDIVEKEKKEHVINFLRLYKRIHKVDKFILNETLNKKFKDELSIDLEMIHN